MAASAMAQTKHQIQDLLAQAGSQPRHRFGQNFMIDQNLVRVVADAGLIAPGDVVIEVGPGTGTLTEELLSRGADVVAVEIDRDLAKLLRERFASEARVTLIEGDALSSKHALNEDLLGRLAAVRSTAGSAAARSTKLVANLPYNIASPLIIELLLARVDLLAFTVQKEVADRLRAAAGSDAYGPLSVMAQKLAKVEALRTLPPQAFWPAPKIESALVRMTRHDDQPSADAPAFGRFVHKLFSFRRKTLRKALVQAGMDAVTALAKTGLDPQVRPEVLSGRQLTELFAAVGSAGASEEPSAPAGASPPE
jgi:16S rRNA (adenine1518-N6/adenine1519-N6)-dimethyltransferase